MLMITPLGLLVNTTLDRALHITCPNWWMRSGTQNQSERCKRMPTKKYQQSETAHYVLKSTRRCEWGSHQIRTFQPPCWRSVSYVSRATIVPLWNTSDTSCHGQPKKDTMSVMQNCERMGAVWGGYSIFIFTFVSMSRISGFSTSSTSRFHTAVAP